MRRNCLAELGKPTLHLVGGGVELVAGIGRLPELGVLGAVLLVLSFVYNRFAEAMRRWL